MATLDYSTGNPDAVILDASEEIISETKRSLFSIDKFIKQIQKEVKCNFIVIDKTTQKDMVTDKVGVPNEGLNV